MKEKSIKELIKNLKYEFEDLEIKEKQIKIKYLNNSFENIYIEKMTIRRSLKGKIEVIIESKNEDIVRLLEGSNLKRNENGILENNDLFISYEEYYSYEFNFENIFRTNLKTVINEIGARYIVTLETSKRFVYRKNENYKKKDSVVLKEWYTNALKHMKLFSNSCEESYGMNYKSGIEEVKIFGKSHSDNILINLDEFSFKINKEEGDKDISIEYSDEYGGIPTEEIRSKISLFFSFIMDRELIKLGESKYYYDDKNEYSTHILFESVRNGVDGNALSRLNEFSNVFFGDKFFYSSHSLKFELESIKKTLEKIIKNYLNCSNHYKFDNIIHRYLNTKVIRLDYSIPIKVTGLEMLANIISKDQEFERIVNNEVFENFLKNLIDVPEELKGKIKNLNNIGIGQKLIKLVESFGLDYSKYRIAFKVRNDLNHGSTKVSISDMLLSDKLLRELIILIILKTLDYDYVVKLSNGEYIKFDV
ncbi:MAG: hypothetical protein ACRC51_00400 [Cetobacterium sp.]